MEYGNEKYTDAELKEALIRTNGQPTKAAEALGVTYQSVYGRIRSNPELLEVQKSARQKTFQDLSNFQVGAVLAGIVKSPELDEDGNVKWNTYRQAEEKAKQFLLELTKNTKQ